jgi:hypothetical protein
VRRDLGLGVDGLPGVVARDLVGLDGVVPFDPLVALFDQVGFLSLRDELNCR